MARKPRIHVVGGLYHVMLRGNAGQEIFLDDADRDTMLGLIAEGVTRFGHLVCAYAQNSRHPRCYLFALDRAMVRLSQKKRLTASIPKLETVARMMRYRA